MIGCLLWTAVAASALAEPLVLDWTEAAALRVPWLKINDAKGTYSIPYIQSASDLEVRLAAPPAGAVKVEVTLRFGSKVVQKKTASADQAELVFRQLKPAEYALELAGLDSQGRASTRVIYSPAGIGTIVAAIGDSITEGYLGEFFHREDLNLMPDHFPPAAASRDRRNYPQFAPTAYRHMPRYNCFKSWMPMLNDALTASLKQPVFIANEGWGGITTEGYLKMIREDANWQAKMRQLRPQVWLIHLGVNDERAKRPDEAVGHDLEAIVDELVREHAAEPRRILVARPCYDYHPGAEAILKGYIARIDQLVQRRGLSKGPDFFDAYSRQKERWYGSDPVHPNVEGMALMAKLWHEAIVAALPKTEP